MTEVIKVLNGLSAVKSSDISYILDQQPVKWLTKAKKNDIVAWWKSPARRARIEAIGKGIGDGSYL
jgi:hypothetical protein